jgi:hypothetical protein
VFGVSDAHICKLLAQLIDPEIAAQFLYNGSLAAVRTGLSLRLLVLSPQDMRAVIYGMRAGFGVWVSHPMISGEQNYSHFLYCSIIIALILKVKVVLQTTVFSAKTNTHLFESRHKRAKECQLFVTEMWR